MSLSVSIRATEGYGEPFTCILLLAIGFLVCTSSGIEASGGASSVHSLVPDVVGVGFDRHEDEWEGNGRRITSGTIEQERFYLFGAYRLGERLGLSIKGGVQRMEVSGLTEVSLEGLDCDEHAVAGFGSLELSGRLLGVSPRTPGNGLDLIGEFYVFSGHKHTWYGYLIDMSDQPVEVGIKSQLADHWEARLSLVQRVRGASGRLTYGFGFGLFVAGLGGMRTVQIETQTSRETARSYVSGSYGGAVLLVTLSLRSTIHMEVCLSTSYGDHSSLG